MIEGLLLAGGTGSRFGSHKLVHPLAPDLPLVRQSALNLLAALSSVRVVHRPEDQRLLAALEGLPLWRLASARCAAGMGASLAAGVAASPAADGWIIALGDMPWVSPDTVRAVRTALESGASIVVPTFNGQRGHPVGFSAQWREALCALDGDAGARHLLATHPEAVHALAVADPHILRDVDVPADLARG